MINEAITYNFMNSFKSDKDLIVEKNILNNPYVKIVKNKCFQLSMALLNLKNILDMG